MTDDLYYRKMESTSTTDLVDMIRERDKRIAELEEDIQNLEGIKLAQETALSTEYIIEEQLQKENADLKEQIEKMRNFQNCDYQLHIIDCPIFKSGGHISCKKCPHWILQEIKEK